MTARQGTDGSASIAALTMLTLLAAAAAGGSLVLQAAFVSASRSSDREQLRHSLQEEGERMVGLIAGDPTPEADSPSDPIWRQIARPANPDVHIFLEDVSSRLNANWVQEDIFEKTGLGQLLSAGTTAQQLQQRREDEGISTDVASEYADLIAESALSRYFTGYGYANPNVTDEFALRALYEVRMADREGAEVFHARMQNALVSKKLLKRDDLRELLGLDYGKLFPLVNVEPVLNVHFVEPLVLGELISLPELRIPRPREIAQALVDLRDSSEVTAERLRQIVGAPDDNRIYQYLGVVTWFWKLTLTRGSARLELIVARVPSADGGTPRFLIVEERYFP